MLCFRDATLLNLAETLDVLEVEGNQPRERCAVGPAPPQEPLQATSKIQAKVKGSGSKIWGLGLRVWGLVLWV